MTKVAKPPALLQIKNWIF